ncbi:MAG: hypothetical protein HQ523_05815 [Lentisphaerae bacterium]|nr:hypothetical protein [Lentisphaerota bacterium]
MENVQHTICILVDNGSIRAEAALFTRKLARELGAAAGLTVQATSLAHSDRIDLAELEQCSVPLLTPLLEECGRSANLQRILVLPLMLATGGAVYRKTQAAVEAAALAFADTTFLLGDGLLSEDETVPGGMVRILADGVRATVHREQLTRPIVVVVDHGSPERAAAEARNEVGSRMAHELNDTVSGVVVASMERRDGEAYDFNEPLLRAALSELAVAGRTDVVLVRLFLQPGRHSGVDGDIDRICEAVIRDHPDLRLHHPARALPTERLIPLLMARLDRLQRMNAAPAH